MPKRPPFQYYGGKFYLVPTLLKLFPPHEVYVEVFGGSGVVLLNKERSRFEIFNDINGDLCNFFKVLIDDRKFKKFLEKLKSTPYSREFFHYCKEKLRKRKYRDAVERALCFFVQTSQSFSGEGKTWSFGWKRNQAKRFADRLELLPTIKERFRGVYVENLHWKECLEKYKDIGFERELLYLDPPYLPETRRKTNTYKQEMTYEDHEELIDYLLTHKRRVILSGYDNPLYQKLEKYGWKKVCFEVPCHAEKRKGGKRSSRLECLWFNY